jgi:transcriptional regulator with XRE-family HTH domain
MKGARTLNTSTSVTGPAVTGPAAAAGARPAPPSAAAPGRSVGELLRAWRERRRLSQLELSSRVEISSRHLSFIETGRSRPSAEMVLRITDHLDVPLRARNAMLLSAGFAPAFAESALDTPPMAGILTAVRQVLRGHEPYPALALDRHWDLVEANRGIEIFTSKVAPALLAGPVNVGRLSLHPDGLAPHIVNLGEWRAHLLGRLRREIDATGDAELADLYAELRELPGGDGGDGDGGGHDHPDGPPRRDAVVLPLRFRHDGRELAFVSTTAVFGTPVEVTVSELAIESFFPADEATGRALAIRNR